MASGREQKIQFLIQYVHDRKVAEEVVTGLNKIGKAAGTTGINLKQLIERAAVTIPVWAALRTVLNLFNNTMREGVEQIVQLDMALGRARMMAKNVGDIGKFVGGLRDEFNRLEITTGKGIPELSKAFETLSRGLQDSSLAQEILTNVMDASLVTQSDSNDIAESAIRLYKIMGDTMEGVSTPADKLRLAIATMSNAYTEIGVNMEEYIGMLDSSIARAKLGGLTFNQFTTLIKASGKAMQAGATQGTTLMRSILMLIQNIEKVEVLLGQGIAPGTSFFDVLLKTMEKIGTLDTTAQANELMNIFGIRGANAAAVLGIIKDELKDIGKIDVSAGIKRAADDATLMKQRLAILSKDISELQGVIGEGFLTGLTGTTDFESALTKVKDSLVGIKNLSDEIGKSVATWGPLIAGLMLGKAFGPTGVAIGGLVGGSMTGAKLLQSGVDKVEKADIGLRIKSGLQEFFGQFKLTYGRDFPGQVGLGRRKDAVFNIPWKDGGLEPLPKEFLQGTKESEAQAIQMDEVEKARIAAQISKEITANKQKQVDLGTENIKLLERELLSADRLQSSGYTSVEIEVKKWEILKRRSKDSGELWKQEQEIIKAINTEVMKLSENLHGAFTDAISGFVKGETDIKGSFDKIAKTWNDALVGSFSEGMVNKLFKTTGIGEMFGVQMASIKQFLGGGGGGISGSIQTGFDYGADLTYNKIVAAFSMGTSGVGGGGGGTSSSLGGVGNLLNMFGFGKQVTNPSGPQQYATIKNANGTVSQVPVAEGNVEGGASTSPSPWSSVGTYANIGMFAYQGSQLYKQKGSGNVWGNSMNMGMSGAMAGSAFGPVGTIVGAVVGAVWGGIMGGRSKTENEIAVNTSRIASKIDTTNKGLEYVNRNLIALKSTMETYILPTSAYFSEKRNIEDQYSLISTRGFMG